MISARQLKRVFSSGGWVAGTIKLKPRKYLSICMGDILNIYLMNLSSHERVHV